VLFLRPKSGVLSWKGWLEMATWHGTFFLKKKLIFVENGQKATKKGVFGCFYKKIGDFELEKWCFGGPKVVF
jgi:hypothetical protein